METLVETVVASARLQSGGALSDGQSGCGRLINGTRWRSSRRQIDLNRKQSAIEGD